MCKPYTLIVSDIVLPLDASFEEAFSVARARLKKLHLPVGALTYGIYRKSIDARKKDNIKFVYSVSAVGQLTERDIDAARVQGISVLKEEKIEFKPCSDRSSAPVCVVGSGPCGLFCALTLAEYGYRVLLIERGESIENRNKAVERFKRERILDVNSNIQFGAGGAGTFSDGKLVTRINDAMSGYVLRKFVEFGAPEEILYQAKPHIGTDILSVIVDKMISRITELGSVVMYNTTFLDFIENGGRITGVKTSNGDFSCSSLVLAIGHSARDTYERLIAKNIDIVAKDFSVGMRIEHSTEIIDSGMYGNFAGHKNLAHAEYTLSHNTSSRGVYTFCMCPGGVVVPAASEPYGVVVNGMSYHKRDGRNSNSAICCSIFKDDYGATPLKAIEFQRSIERAAFRAAGSDYSAPIITVGDFLADECRTEPTDILPTYMDGFGVKLVDPNKYLPKTVVDSIKGGLLNFDKKIKGFTTKSAILTGPETRTSSPVRILRDSATRLAEGYTNLYPSGEGAGYAGGITSAAIDGIKTAVAIMNNF